MFPTRNLNQRLGWSWLGNRIQLWGCSVVVRDVVDGGHDGRCDQDSDEEGDDQNGLDELLDSAHNMALLVSRGGVLY